MNKYWGCLRKHSQKILANSQECAKPVRNLVTLYHKDQENISRRYKTISGFLRYCSIKIFAICLLMDTYWREQFIRRENKQSGKWSTGEPPHTHTLHLFFYYLHTTKKKNTNTWKFGCSNKNVKLVLKKNGALHNNIDWQTVKVTKHWHTLYTFSSIICTRQKSKIPILESLAAPIKTSSWY